MILGEGLFTRAYSDRARENGLKLESRLRLDIGKKFLGSEALEHVAQRGYGYPIPGGAQGQASCGSEQPDLSGSLPTAAELKLKDL